MAGSRSTKEESSKDDICAKFGSGLLSSACKLMKGRTKRVDIAVEGSVKGKNKKNTK